MARKTQNSKESHFESPVFTQFKKGIDIALAKQAKLERAAKRDHRSCYEQLAKAVSELVALYNKHATSAMNVDYQTIEDVFSRQYSQMRDFFNSLEWRNVIDAESGEPEVVLMVASFEGAGTKRKKIYLPFGLPAPKPQPESTVDWEGKKKPNRRKARNPERSLTAAEMVKGGFGEPFVPEFSRFKTARKEGEKVTDVLDLDVEAALKSPRVKI